MSSYPPEFSPTTIRSLQFLPCGRGLVSCADDGRVILWDPATLKAVRTIEEPGQAIFSMAVQADGWHVVTGSVAGEMKRWDLKSGEGELCCPGEGLTALSVVLSPDEKKLMAAFSDGTVRIVDRERATLLWAFWNVGEGFFLFTPPDEHAPDGWVWTDRDDLLHVVEQDDSGRVIGAVPFNDERRRAYVHTRNNARMVQARLKGLGEYARTAGPYRFALTESQIEAMAGYRPMLPERFGRPPDPKADVSRDASVSGKEGGSDV